MADGDAPAEEPPKKEMIKLVSKEGHEFTVEKQAAMVSNTIKSMLTGPGMFTEQESDTITFPEISKEVMEEVIKYFYYKLRYANEPMPPEFPIEPSMALELLMAANYLDT